MEAVVPLFALGSLLVVNRKQRAKKEAKEGFNNTKLPNANVPDRNYSPAAGDVSTETDKTSQLSTVNKYVNPAGAYTDKYFTVNDQNASEEFTSISGMNVDKSYFQHNNMTPFFGSRARGSMRDDTANEAVLDNYTGSGSQDVAKRERGPLFAPEDNLHWTHGTPNQSDFLQERINPSMRKANELPFKQEQVAPGLGLGPTTEGGDGFNSGMMERSAWMPKNVDNLRTESNPKAGGIRMIGHEGPAAARVKNIGREGKFEKNRPDRHYETGPERWFTTTGLVKEQTSRAEQVDRITNRQDTTREHVPAAAQYTAGEYIPGEYRESHNIQLGEVPLGHAAMTGKSEARANEHGRESAKAYPNNRTVGQQETYFGALTTSVSAAMAPILDVMRPSRKENAIGTLRPYQNPGTRVSESYVYNPKSKARTTHRESMVKSDRYLNIDGNQHGGAYQSTEHQVAYTTRAETGNYEYSGVAASTQGKKMKSYDSVVKNQRNNDIKSSTIEGRLVRGNAKLLNHEANVRVATNRAEMLKNNRAQIASMPTQVPTARHIGESSVANNSLDINVQAERADPSILDALKSNPYVIDFTKFN